MRVAVAGGRGQSVELSFKMPGHVANVAAGRRKCQSM